MIIHLSFHQFSPKKKVFFYTQNIFSTYLQENVLIFSLSSLISFADIAEKMKKKTKLIFQKFKTKHLKEEKKNTQKLTNEICYKLRRENDGESWLISILANE